MQEIEQWMEQLPRERKELEIVPHYYELIHNGYRDCAGNSCKTGWLVLAHKHHFHPKHAKYAEKFFNENN
jgi:hypothetical protein